MTRPGPSHRRPHRWLFLAVAYGLPVLLTAAAVTTWVSPGSSIAAGDVPPFEWRASTAELGSLWNHQIVGAGSASYGIVRAPQIGLVWLAAALGLSGSVAQYVFYLLVWCFAALGGAVLAAVWTRRAAAIATAGLAAAFNAYLLVNHPNPLPAVAIGLLGVLLALTLRSAAGRDVGGATFAVLTLPAALLAQNPPLVAVLAVTVAGTALSARLLVGPGGTVRALRLLARAAPWVLLLNAWWLVPYAVTLLAMPGLVLGATADVSEWSWTHAQASLANVATLNSHWGWPQLQYFPYRPAMEATGWPVLRWVLPGLAVLGVVLADRVRRPTTLVLGGLCLVLVGLGTGMHAPLGPVNTWLFDHVPGAWLLRNPAMKLAVPQVLCYSALAAVAVDRLLALRPGIALRSVLRTGTVLTAVVAVAAPWPLWTGAVVPWDKHPLPGSHVTVPADWRRVADAVNAGPGKVLILPLDPFYQVRTDWGYYGTDMIPAQMLTRPVVQPLPGGYFRAAGSSERIAAGVQSSLATGDTAAALRGLRTLGVGQVIVRHDLVNGPMTTVAVDGVQLRTAADAALTGTLRTRVADVYRVPDATGMLAAYGSIAGLVDDGDGEVWQSLPDVPAGTVLSADRGLPADQVQWQPGGPGAFALAAAGRYRIEAHNRAAVFRVELARRRHGAQLSFTDTTSVVVDGVELPPQPPVTVPVDRRTVAIAAAGRLYPLTEGGTLVQVPAQATLTAYVPARGSALGGFGPVGDCNRVDAVDPAVLAERPTPDTVRLSALAHTACVSADVSGVAGGALLLQFDHRTVSGRPARICLWQAGPQRCAELPDPPAAPGEWRTHRAVVWVEPDAGPLSLFLYADAGPERTVVEYRRVQVQALRATAEQTVTLPDRQFVDRDLAAGRHEIVMDQQVPPTLLGEPGPLGNCNSVSGRPAAELGLRLDRLPGDALQLGASRDAACVALATTGPVYARYRLTLQYRTVSGRTARVCLWQAGPDRCATLPPLVRSQDWNTLSAAVRPEPGTRALSLYLYADGAAETRTVEQFRAVALAVEPGLSVSLRPGGEAPETPAAPPPRVRVSVHGPADATVTVHGAAGHFALVLTEAGAPGWRLDGLPRGWRAERFTANGYAAAWRVEGRGDAVLRVRYAPDRYGALARSGSAGSAAAALLWMLVRRRRRRG